MDIQLSFLPRVIILLFTQDLRQASSIDMPTLDVSNLLRILIHSAPILHYHHRFLSFTLVGTTDPLLLAVIQILSSDRD